MPKVIQLAYFLQVELEILQSDQGYWKGLSLDLSLSFFFIPSSFFFFFCANFRQKQIYRGGETHKKKNKGDTQVVG